MISAEWRIFRDLMFLGADSENMKNSIADERCLKTERLWFALHWGWSKRKISALVSSEQRCLIKTLFRALFLCLKRLLFRTEKRWFNSDLLWISSDIYTGLREYQNVITSKVMKKNEVVIKMAFMQLKNVFFFQFSAKLHQKFKLPEVIFENHPGNCFSNFNRIRFVTWAVPRKPKNSNFCFIFGLRENRRTKFLLFTYFLQIWLKFRVLCLEIEVLLNFSKKRKINRKMSFWNPEKAILFSAVSRKSALFISDSVLFSSESAVISSESALFQWKSALKQHWCALIFSAENFPFQRCSHFFT